jgi:hypothetical protein
MTTAATASIPEWDAFISHATEDKDAFVRPLAVALNALGARVWYDEFSLNLGDSLSESVDRGLANSRFGIVVISQAFIGKAWPRRELQGLVARELAGRSTILPIWHEVTLSEVMEFSPPLADKLAVLTSNGADKIALQILLQIRPDLASGRPYEELQAIASGKAVAALKAELETLRERIEEFQCPFCKAKLTASVDAPVDQEEQDWDVHRTFECGYSDFAGQITRPCPTDPAFPKFTDYEISCTSDSSEVPFMRWNCHAIGKTEMARCLSLKVGHGTTEDRARADLREDYESHARARPWL